MPLTTARASKSAIWPSLRSTRSKTVMRRSVLILEQPYQPQPEQQGPSQRDQAAKDKKVTLDEGGTSEQPFVYSRLTSHCVQVDPKVYTLFNPSSAPPLMYIMVVPQKRSLRSCWFGKSICGCSCTLDPTDWHSGKRVQNKRGLQDHDLCSVPSFLRSLSGEARRTCIHIDLYVSCTILMCHDLTSSGLDLMDVRLQKIKLSTRARCRSELSMFSSAGRPKILRIALESSL